MQPQDHFRPNFLPSKIWRRMLWTDRGCLDCGCAPFGRDNSRTTVDVAVPLERTAGHGHASRRSLAHARVRLYSRH